jgi:putative membrane protein
MSSASTETGHTHQGRNVVLWLGIACILIAGIAFSWNPTPLAQALAALFILCALVHAALYYRAGTALALFAICLLITFTMENIGSLTGFPFGRYHFQVDAGLPHIGIIPMIVGPLWFGGGYFSWIVAGVLLDGVDNRLDRTYSLLALPTVAAFVMTQWDLVMDSPNSTIAKIWIWHDGGAMFGVPLSNYLGWFLTSWLLFFAFALYLRGRRPAARLSIAVSREKLQAIAILFYLSSGLTHLVPWVIGQSGEVEDAAGHAWRIADIRESTVAIMLFTMLFTATLAAIRLYDRARDRAPS